MASGHSISPHGIPLWTLTAALQCGPDAVSRNRVTDHWRYGTLSAAGPMCPATHGTGGRSACGLAVERGSMLEAQVEHAGRVPFGNERY